MNAKQLYQQAEQLFSKRTTLMSLWQELADNFHPMRADFTYTRTLGTDFAADLMTSYPPIVARELQDQVTTMLRPTAKPWFHMGCVDTRRENQEAKAWLGWATGTMRRAMEDRASNFAAATKAADGDFSTFGNAVISVRLNHNRDRLLYRNFHLRDCVWQNDGEEKICFVARRYKPWARDLLKQFGKDKLHHDVVKAAQGDNPFLEVSCMHIVVAADMYDGDARGRPWFHITYDCDHDTELEAVPTWTREYVIPRWQVWNNTQYGFSPAAVIGLPEARLLQAMAFTLLEAGEKMTNPPIIATEQVVRGDVSLLPGAITWVDRDYDEKLGSALRPMPLDMKGMPLGIQMSEKSQAIIMQAFYLNKLQLPVRRPEMTAFEVGQYVAQWIRDAMPIFEPMEQNYNGELCEMTFEVGRHAMLFGSPYDMPQSLRGQELQFRFESPLHDVIEQQKGNAFIEMKQLVAAAIDVFPGATALVDWKGALRDALNGVQTPPDWLNSESTVADIEQQQQNAAQAQEMLQAMEQGSVVAKNLGQAQQAGAGAQAEAMAA